MTGPLHILNPVPTQYNRTFDEARVLPARLRPPLQRTQPLPDITVVIPIFAAINFEVDLPYGAGDRSLAALLYRDAADALTAYCARRHPQRGDAAEDYADGELTWDQTDFLLTYNAYHTRKRRHAYIDNGGALLHLDRN